MFNYLWKRLAARKGSPPSRQHIIALRYWENCSNTCHASPEYYDRCETELRGAILPRVGRLDRLLDAGCGNGRFTLVLAGIAGSVDAYDVSPDLIRQARRAAQLAGVSNVQFRVGDISALTWPPSFYNLVSCMGVLSTIIDEPAFLKVAQKLAATVRPGGFVLLRDTLSLQPEGELVQTDVYAIRYRHQDHYRRTLARLGMELEYESTLINADPLVNRFFLYRRASRPQQ
jgi:2-polyprenyl-3-methyl-5-hydroxy-6-metoxy-1,4-benzoquinol methylase